MSIAAQAFAMDEQQRRAASRPDLLCLAGGFPADELLPRGALGRAFTAAIARHHGGALQYGWPEGNARLRQLIAARLWARGAKVGADDIVVTAGAQQALAIATEMIVEPGDTVAIEARSYPGAIDLFRRAGAAMTSDPGARARVAYVMPGVSNPYGRGIRPEERAALLKSGARIIADEAYAELRFDGRIERPLLVDARDRTFHIGTFSKSLSPGLRVGYLVAPPLFVKRARALKQTVDLEAAALTQGVLAELLKRDNFDARLARSRRIYQERATRMVRSLSRRFPSFRLHEPEGGFSVFVETGVEGDEEALLDMAIEHGVSFDVGSRFAHELPPSPVTMRISFSNIGPLWIDEATSRLAKAFTAWSKAPKARPTSYIRELAPTRQSRAA